MIRLDDPGVVPPEPKPAANLAPLCVDAVGLAALLDVSPRTVRRLDDAGRIPTPIALGGCKRWSIDAIQSWLRSGAPPRP